MPISLLLVDIVLEGVVRANMQETEIKDTYVKKKKSRTISICRGQDSICRKSHRIHKKTIRGNKYIWDFSNVQDQHTNVTCAPINK